MTIILLWAALWLFSSKRNAFDDYDDANDVEKDDADDPSKGNPDYLSFTNLLMIVITQYLTSPTRDV